VEGVAVRNHRWVDWWSLSHVAWGLALTLAAGPWIAFVVLVAWEPVEVFVLSPVLARVGVAFGREGWRNSVSDVGFDAIGVTAGVILLRLVGEPFGSSVA
jgi:hypothetical protein